MGIKLEHVSHIFNPGTTFEKAALRNICLEIGEGEFIGLIGHTGSGKSTLVQHMNGLIKPMAGTVYYDGADICGDGFDMKKLRTEVGLVFQYPEYQLFEETVAKDIAYGPKNMGLGKDEIDRRVRESARLVGLTEEQLASSPFDLSGGQKRRAAIAGVMAMEPKVLILDEPASGLDPHGREQIFGMIKQYHKERGGTVLIVSHSMEDIARYADRILVMNEGRVFCFDKTPEVFRRSAELEQIGLAVPQITRIIMRLNEMGCGLPEDVYTVKYAEGLIAEKLAGR